MTQEGYTVAQGILAVMTRELSCYGAIIDLTRMQVQALDASDSEMLMSIVRKKQRYVGRVQVLRAEADRLRGGWERIRESADEPVRLELRRTADKLAAVISEALTLEQETIARVEVLKAGVKEKAQTLHAARNKVLGYMRTGTAGRMDRKV